MRVERRVDMLLAKQWERCLDMSANYNNEGSHHTSDRVLKVKSESMAER